MKSIYQCFARLRKLKEDKSIMDYENSIKKKFPRTAGAASVTTPMNKNKK